MTDEDRRRAAVKEAAAAVIRLGDQARSRAYDLIDAAFDLGATPLEISVEVGRQRAGADGGEVPVTCEFCWQDKPDVSARAMCDDCARAR